MLAFTYALVFALGVGLMWLWTQARKDVRPPQEIPKLPDVSSGPKDPVPQPCDNPKPGSPAGATTISERLTSLSEALDAEFRAAPHPRDLPLRPIFTEVRKILSDPAVPLKTVQDYALGSNGCFSCAALDALRERPDRDSAVPAVISFCDVLSPWALYFAMKLFLAMSPRPPAGTPLIAVREWWRDDMYLISLWRDHFDERESLGDKPESGAALADRPQHQIEIVRDFLNRMRHPYATALLQELDIARSASVDRAFLTSFGRFWNSEDLSALIEPAEWNDGLAAIHAKSIDGMPSSLLVSGEARVGKSSFLRLLAQRLASDGWTIFEAGGADLMAGQQWFGQLEGRIQKCVEELAASKKLIWYIPDILQTALSGTHQGQAASILDQILPAIAARRLVVWTEASATATAKLLRMRPSLRNTFEVVRLEPMNTDETLDMARALAGKLASSQGITVEPEAIEVASASARQYLSASQLPGSVLDLLQLSIIRAAKGSMSQIGPSDVIATLSQLTGLPSTILDGQERVNLSAVRDYFASRVIGQDEAVDAIVERIAMLKAGLTDPGKPIGVFLFAGPTGTGKTELAKTLAEFLFGSHDRMVRLDMSEFQTPESTSKILGSGEGSTPGDSLITLIRKQPFSVVLLDEFEKAHPNVWDIFLQVFDDGRLTDQAGHVADFRHSIVILTSNLGATSHRSARLGFAPGASSFTSEQVMQVISQTFRPEFQNRLDKVIVFRPLSRDLMRGILRKELARVLERRGLKDKEWAVEWEASALEFLLEKGFSPEMGARPLKRAIDQYVIAPLAATIVEKRFPEGDQFVFIRSDGKSIQAEFVDPDEEKPEIRGAPRAWAPNARGLQEIILTPDGSEAESVILEDAFESILEVLASAEWENIKYQSTARMSESGFWSDPLRFEVLSRISLIDRVRAATDTASALKIRLDKSAGQSGKASRELASRLALQLYLVEQGIQDIRENAPIEIALVIEPAFDKPADREAASEWCTTIEGMYRQWGRNRNMHLSEAPAGIGDGAPHTRTLLVSGFGAARTLQSEQGLHVLERAEEGSPQRAAARVRVVHAPLGDLPPALLRNALNAALEKAERSNIVVRRYRKEPAPLVRDLAAGWRTGRLESVLNGNFDLLAASREE